MINHVQIRCASNEYRERDGVDGQNLHIYPDPNQYLTAICILGVHDMVNKTMYEHS